MTFGSLFSGIGGFDVGLERAGMRCTWQVEKYAGCLRVLARHWPNVRRHDDVCGVTVAAEPVRPDLICGGFPCQDLSVAGKRAGLAGKRSGLFFEFMRIVRDFAPAWVLIENVPGLLSSNEGRDMGVVCGALGQLGYGFAYRVLDAQWFGVPQRRRRVFIVGCLRNWRRAAEVLFERESLPWDSPPCRQTGTRVAASLTQGSGVRSNNPGRRCEDDVNLAVTHTHTHTQELSLALTQGGRFDGESETFIACTLRAEGHDASEDGTGRGVPLVFDERQNTSRHNRSNPQPGDRVTRLHSDAPRLCGGFKRGQGDGYQLEQAPTLTSADSAGVHVGMVRRLMPVECERLQGFDDGWTERYDNGETVSDSARYRMLGNAVAVPVAQWLGRRILEAQA